MVTDNEGVRWVRVDNNRACVLVFVYLGGCGNECQSTSLCMKMYSSGVIEKVNV